jgi:hypothetical protein
VPFRVNIEEYHNIQAGFAKIFILVDLQILAPGPCIKPENKYENREKEPDIIHIKTFFNSLR